jgi:hypothetical protein
VSWALETTSAALSTFNSIANLFLSGFDRSRERVLKLIALASPSFKEFYFIVKDPSVGLRHEDAKELVENYFWTLLPVGILAFIVYLLLGVNLDFLTAGIGSYAVCLGEVPLVLWFGHRRIPGQVKGFKGRLINSREGKQTLITFFHLKALFQYALLTSIGLLATALKTLTQTPGALLQGIGLLQNEIVDMIILLFIIVTLLAPLWLLRRVQVEAIRQVEDLLFKNHFGLTFPQVEVIVNRKLGVEKVWGRVTAIGKRIEVSKASNYVENFEWRDIIGVATLREG